MICRGKCLGTLRKLVRLNNDIEAIEVELETSVGNLLKNSSSNMDEIGGIPEMKTRTELGTPVRRALRSLPIQGQASSPTLAVSQLHR